MRKVILGQLLLTLLWFLVGLADCIGQQTSSIRVTVTDEQGAVVAGTEVGLVEAPNLIGRAATNGIAVLENVPAGTYQVRTVHKGFREEVIAGVVVVEGKTTVLTVKMRQAPPAKSDFTVTQELPEPQRYYSDHLAEIAQPLLCAQTGSGRGEWYRFIWVPTFYRPIFLRIDIGPDGTATLLSYVWRGPGGYEWGKTTRSLRKLTLGEESDLFATLADVGFWALPSQVENPRTVVVDGTEWLIEGVKDGKCHVVTRDSSPLTDVVATQFLKNVANLDPYSDAVMK